MHTTHYLPATENMRLSPILLFAILAALFLLAACGVPSRTHQLAFESDRDGNTDVYLVDTDGENLVRLTDEQAYDGTPSWSPDGQRIAFTSERSGNPDIYLMDADAGNVVRLTEGDGVFNVVPEWSPDGSQILFISNRTYKVRGGGGSLEVPANPKIWVMQSDGA